MIFVKLSIWRAESGILQPSSSSPLGHWTFSSHLLSRMWHLYYGIYWHIVLWNIFTNFTSMMMINMPSPPHGSFGKKLPFLVIFWAYLQEWSFADVPLVSSEYAFLQVLLLTPLLVHPVLTLNMIVAEELLRQADLHTRPPPVSGCAHQVILAAFFLIYQLDFTAGQNFLLTLFY